MGFNKIVINEEVDVIHVPVGVHVAVVVLHGVVKVLVVKVPVDLIFVRHKVNTCKSGRLWRLLFHRPSLRNLDNKGRRGLLALFSFIFSCKKTAAAMWFCIIVKPPN